MNKILLFFPSVADNAEITKSVAILNGIAKQHGWKTDYFDTYEYEKSEQTVASVNARSNTGEVKSFASIDTAVKPREELFGDLQNKIDTFKPDIIAISCSSYEYDHLLTILPKIKIPKETLILIGGVHAVLKPDEVIATGLFDMVCTGDGEETFNELLTKYDNREDLRHIDNIYFRDKKSGEVIKNPRRRLTDESILWKFKQDYSLFDDKYFIYPYHGKLYRRFRFEVGRGCPYNCTYCANSALRNAYQSLGKYFRSRPLDTIKDDMENIMNGHNIEMFLIEDECLLAHSDEWLNDFFEWYGRVIKKPFILQTRPETVTEEKIRILEKANAPFFQVKMGVESGSPRILHEICNRMMKVEQIISAFDVLHKHNITAAACLIIGFPTETREEIFETINLCRRIKPDEMLVNIFQPMPGQQLRDLCIEKGYIKPDDKPHFFTDRSILNMPHISQKEIESLRRVFPLYVILPEEYFHQIERCEKDYENNVELYNELVQLRWKLAPRD